MGNELVRTLLGATGLPLEISEKMFFAVLKKHNLSADHLTLEDLRVVIADFMQDILVEAKTKFQ